MPELDWSDMPIHQAFKADWRTPEIELEGSLNCAKSTLAIDKEIDAVHKYPGIPCLWFRWSDDAVQTKLRPAIDDVLAIRGVAFTFSAKEKRYEFENGSIAYCFGLKATSATERFSKIRSLGVCRIMGDQVEEMERVVADELRGRLRPDITATLAGRRFPYQLTFVANPSGDDFWLSKQFLPDDHPKKIEGRKLYSVSVFQNKHADPKSVESLLRTYDESHPKYRTMVLGLRGLNVSGDPVFEAHYSRERHLSALGYDPTLPLLEAYEVGKHNPVWVAAQRSRTGTIRFLGGVFGRGLMLTKFLPFVAAKKRLWFPNATGQMLKTCTAPMGEKQTQKAERFTLVRLLRKSGLRPLWKDNANAHDVRLTMIESIVSQLQMDTDTDIPGLLVNSTTMNWVVLSTDESKETPFLQHCFEGGFVWDDHTVSVSNMAIRQAAEDDEYSNIMRACENIVLNFCAGKPTEAEKAAKRAALRGDNPQENLSQERSPLDWAR